MQFLLPRGRVTLGGLRADQAYARQAERFGEQFSFELGVDRKPRGYHACGRRSDRLYPRRCKPPSAEGAVGHRLDKNSDACDEPARPVMYSRDYMIDPRAETFVKTLVFEADLGNCDPLGRLLVSDEPLTADDRERLAWLIIRRVPRGATNTSPSARKAALACATYLVWQGRQVLRRHQFAEPKMAAREALIRASISIVEKEFGLPASSISQADVSKGQRHGGSRTVVDYVRDYMPGATEKIRTLAMTICCLDTPANTVVGMPKENGRGISSQDAKWIEQDA